MHLSTRAYAPSDLPNLVRIEQASQPRAWSGRQFRRFLAGNGVRGFVVEADGVTRAFFVVEPEESGLHLLNIAVDPEVRRQGIARFMLDELEALATAEGLGRVVLEVQETNLPAQLLYKKAGYRAVEILPDHYGEEDGYRMSREFPARSARNVRGKGSPP